MLSLLGLTFSIGFGVAGMVLLLGAILLGATALRERPEQPTPAAVPPDEVS
ncbi:hypothetical protein [Egicoccus halophilus]|uniref:hypothetical protein n=1 Tax=Egicoccus halophilus TaxID=1670830 RepID=UPI00166B500E|nr:hypothetical protein [Egicoccus halophilus]